MPSRRTTNKKNREKVQPRQQPQQQQREFDKMAGETMSISELFNLNSPRGLLGNSFVNDLASPPTNNNNNNFQVSGFVLMFCDFDLIFVGKHTPAYPQFYGYWHTCLNTSKWVLLSCLYFFVS